jgi:hypothetical protein
MGLANCEPHDRCERTYRIGGVPRPPALTLYAWSRFSAFSRNWRNHRRKDSGRLFHPSHFPRVIVCSAGDPKSWRSSAVVAVLAYRRLRPSISSDHLGKVDGPLPCHDADLPPVQAPDTSRRRMYAPRHPRHRFRFSAPWPAGTCPRDWRLGQGCRPKDRNHCLHRVPSKR